MTAVHILQRRYLQLHIAVVDIVPTMHVRHTAFLQLAVMHDVLAAEDVLRRAFEHVIVVIKVVMAPKRVFESCRNVLAIDAMVRDVAVVNELMMIRKMICHA